ELHHQLPGGTLKKGDRVKLIRYRAAKAGDLYLLLGSAAGATIDWGSPIEVTEQSYAYIKGAPAPEIDPKQRLRYSLKYLENADAMVATDAYGEFANAAYADITALAADMPREKLRKWIVDPQLSPSRLGLYGLMLGLCGEEQDAMILKKKVTESTSDFRLGV